MPSRTAFPQRRSIVVIVGLLMAAVVGLGVASMVGSMVIAEINRGMAAAVNQSGTLRMQSYRIAAALTDTTLPLAARQAGGQGIDTGAWRLVGGSAGHHAGTFGEPGRASGLRASLRLTRAVKSAGPGVAQRRPGG